MIGGAATAAATAVLALMVVLDFNGCSKASNKNAQANPCKPERFWTEHDKPNRGNKPAGGPTGKES